MKTALQNKESRINGWMTDPKQKHALTCLKTIPHISLEEKIMADVLIYPKGDLVLLNMAIPDSISGRAAHEKVSLWTLVS